MDAAERLADYLAGELDADEHAAVEAALARDPALRAALGDLQRADAALSSLSSPSPPVGFERRLQAALAPELARQLAAAPSHAGATSEPASTPAERIAADEAAAARARREARTAGARAWRWLPAFGGVAATLLLIAVAVNVVGPLGADDADVAADAGLLESADVEDGAAEDALDDGAMAEALDDPDAGAAEELESDAADDAAEGSALPEADDAPIEGMRLARGPEVVADGRALSPGEVGDLLAVPAARMLAAERLSDLDGAALAAAWSAQLGVPADPGVGITSDDGTPEGDGEAGAALLALLPAERTAVSGCLAELLASDLVDEAAAIPVRVELVTLAGEAAVAYVFVVPDADERFTTPVVRVLARDDCRVLATAGA